MRHLTVLVALLATGSACPADGGQPGLEQVSGDARPRPLPDGSIAVADSAPADPDSDAAGDDTTANERDVEVGPTECDRDGDCPRSACRTAQCDGGRCAYRVAADGTACDDADACTPNAVCQAGVCSGRGLISCADDDPCTEDRCSAATGCEHAPKDCDDDNACTDDTCRAGVGCVSTAVTCAPSAAPCQVAVCTPAIGCTSVPAPDGTACDDGRPCTLDACDAGACTGLAVGCDDGNPCTSDSCLPDGSCDFIPVPGCANDASCIGRLAGASCDDADSATSADMCIAGTCRGYRLTRIAGTEVAGQQGLIVRELDDGPLGWDAVLRTTDLFGSESSLLADVDSTAGPTLHSGTLQSARFAGLRAGFVGDDEGRLWRLTGGDWTNENDWDDALGASARDAIHALFVVQGAGLAGTPTRLAWIVGGGSGEWLRHCKELAGQVVCSAQTLGNSDGLSVPWAIAGVPSCDGAGNCSGAALALGADGWVGGGYNYTDIYENTTGLAVTWQAGYLPETPANRLTRAMTAWTDGEGLRFVAVGANGYLMMRRGDGSWRGPVALRDGQASRDFSGVWAGGGVLVVSADRLGSNGILVYELWTAPLDSDLESGGSWVVHELGRHADVEAAGLYDIAGRSDGEIRVGGGVRRTGGLFDWLDGAIWVRTP